MRTFLPLPKSWFIIASCCLALGCFAAQRTRTELNFPDLPGLRTLRCDFHTHTVFSDGSVWPDIRIEEAWRQGLDAIAITDHIEYLPHYADVSTNNFKRSSELARGAARELGILLIQATEITKGEPPGHWNALFVTNIAAINHTNHLVAVSNAFAQGAFLFWNHPGWKQSDGKSVWYKEQEEVFANGWLHGIEVVNGAEYDPIAQGWASEKKLAVLGNSDVHELISFDYSMSPGDMRPMTLVFARERTPAALKEALFARQTVVFSRGRLIGEAPYLEPLFQGSIEILNEDIRIRGKGSALVQIRNRAPLDFELRLNPKLPEADVDDRLVLPAGKVSLLRVSCVSDRVAGEQRIALPCRVTNLLSGPNKALSTRLMLKITYE